MLFGIDFKRSGKKRMNDGPNSKSLGSRMLEERGENKQYASLVAYTHLDLTMF